MTRLTITGRTRSPLAPVITRHGSPDDVERVSNMHRRCSPESLRRRFHSAQPHVSPRLAALLLSPAGGWSLVAEHYGEVVGLAVAAPLSPSELEIAMLVEDDYQGLGIGGCFARDLAEEARAAGYRTMHCLTQADNHAVLRALRSSGVPVRGQVRNGIAEFVADLTAEPGRLPASA